MGRAAGRIRRRQVISQELDFKHKHRPLSLARIMRRNMLLKSNNCGPCWAHRALPTHFSAAACVCGTKWLFGFTSSFSLLWPSWLEQRPQWHRVPCDGARPKVHGHHAGCYNACGHRGEPQSESAGRVHPTPYSHLFSFCLF